MDLVAGSTLKVMCFKVTLRMAKLVAMERILFAEMIGHTLSIKGSGIMTDLMAKELKQLKLRQIIINIQVSSQMDKNMVKANTKTILMKVKCMLANSQKESFMEMA